MIANKELIIKAAELGILRSMEGFLQEPLKPGRVKARFEMIRMFVDMHLKEVYEQCPDFYRDNKEDITTYLNLLSDSIPWIKGETHIVSVISFCCAFLERSKTKFNPKMYVHLNEIMGYYERAGNVSYKDIYNGSEYDKHWQRIKDCSNDG